MNNLSLNFSDNTFQSLTTRMRPENLAQYIGQQHLLTVRELLPRAIKTGHLHSMVLWGPPGTDKATPAEAIARYANADVGHISAVISGVKEARKAIERARRNRNTGYRTTPSVDEVHRFNKSQQGVLLPHVGGGTITFIDATTENPSFGLSSVLFSRARVYLLRSLSTEDIRQVLTRATEDKIHGYSGQDIVLSDETRRAIAKLVSGDARRALNTLEMMAGIVKVDDSGKQVLKPELLTEVVGEHSARFDDKGDRFYDLISALRKSVRGSTPDAALYWHARIITVGGSPLCAMRRCLAIVSEDVGSVDLRAIQMAITAWDYFTRVGPVEGGRAVARAIVYLACAPKSNTVYAASKAALTGAYEHPGYGAPVHLCNAPMKLMKEMGHGQEYHCVHDEANIYAAGKVYFPPEIA